MDIFGVMESGLVVLYNKVYSFVGELFTQTGRSHLFMFIQVSDDKIKELE